MNANTSPIAFYVNKASQPFRANYRQKEIATICGNDLPPFYIYNVSEDAPQTCELYDANTDVKVADITCAPHLLTHTTTLDGKSVKMWVYQGTSSGIFGDTHQGYYYLKIGSYYSDIFKIGSLPAEYVALEWQLFDDIITTDGALISKYVVYKQIFNTILWHPEYSIEEEGKTNNGIYYPMQQTTRKTSGFSTIVNEAQADILALIAPLADSIKITSCVNGQIREMLTNRFEIRSRWQSDDVTHFECEFDLLTIIRKYQKSETAPNPLPIPTPPEPQTTYKIRGTTISGVSSISFIVAYVGETYKVESVPVTSGQFVFGYNKKLTAFSTGDNFGLHGSTTELKTIDFSESCLFSAATSFSLRNCTNLESVNFGNAKMEYIESISWMFYNCAKLNSVNMPEVTFGSNLQNNAVQDQMFSGCENLTSVSMPKAVIAGAANTTFASTFYGCQHLQTISIPLATFAGGVNFTNFLRGCENLTSVNMPAATFADALIMDNFFVNCGLSNLNVSTIFPSISAHPTSVENICMGAAATTIDLTAIDLSNVTNMKSAFESCRNATTITFDISDVAAVTNWKSAFKHCESMSNISTLFASYTFRNALNVNGIFAYTSENISLPAATFASATDATGMFSYSTATTISIPSATFASYNRDYANICEYADNLTSFNMQSAVFGAIPAGHIYSWFYGCPALQSIDLNSICAQSQVYLLIYSLVIDAASVRKAIAFLQNNNSTISIYQSVYDGFSDAEKAQIQSDLTTYAVNLDFA